MPRSDEISVFDVIGPNMIGPSSSHTAGALRIALLAGHMLGAEPASCVFTLYNSFASTGKGHGTDRALIAGLLGLSADDIRLRDAYELAEQRGLAVRFETAERSDLHPNTVDLTITDQADRKLEVRGVSTGGGRALITRINSVEVDYTGQYNTILINNIDRPGVVASISSVLAEEQINIAFMRLYRERRGRQAFTFIETDEPLTQQVARHLAQIPAVERAIIIPALEHMEGGSS